MHYVLAAFAEHKTVDRSIITYLACEKRKITLGSYSLHPVIETDIDTLMVLPIFHPSPHLVFVVNTQSPKYYMSFLSPSVVKKDVRSVD
jgi:hypothetical protein